MSTYSAATAEQLGVDERTVRRDLRRGKKIIPPVLEVVAGTDMDTGVVLERLADTLAPDRREER